MQKIKCFVLLILIFTFSFALADDEAKKLYNAYANQFGQSYWSKVSIELLPKLAGLLTYRLYKKSLPYSLLYTLPQNTKNPCNGIARLGPDRNITSLIYNIKKDKNGFKIVIVYHGCSGKPIFTEVIQVRGNVEPYSDLQIITGLRSFGLQDGETFKLIGLYNADNDDPAVEVISKRKASGRVETIFLSKEERILDLSYVPNRKVVIYPDNIIIKNHKVEAELIIDFKHGHPQHFIDIDGTPTDSSSDEFVTVISEQIEPSFDKTAGRILDSYLKKFPQVKNLSSGGKQRFKDDVTLFIIRLQSGSIAERNLVISQLRQLQEAMESGAFDYQDKRK